MLIPRTPLMFLVVMTVSVVTACDGEAPSAYPLRAHGLVATWCPSVSELAWTLDVGLAPYELGDVEPSDWPGAISYMASARSSGAGGGRSQTCCGGGATATGCGLRPDQRGARHWRVSERVSLAERPHTLSVRLDAMPGHNPDHFHSDGPVLDLAFSLGPPPITEPDTCVFLPVHKITEAPLSPPAATR